MIEPSTLRKVLPPGPITSKTTGALAGPTSTTRAIGGIFALVGHLEEPDTILYQPSFLTNVNRL